MHQSYTVMASVVACALLGSCGAGSEGGGDGDDTGADADDPVDGAGSPDGAGEQALESPWVDLASARVAVDGGAASGGDAAHVAGPGGTLRLISGGGVLVAASPPLPEPPPRPPLPSGGVVLASADLVADVRRTGTLRVTGAVDAGGADPVRTIVSTDGSIVVDGSLRAALVDGRAQALTLEAPAGAVFVTGTVDTSAASVAPEPRPAGAITIRARWIVIDGSLVARGEASATEPGGDGGAITLHATDDVVLGAGVTIAAGGGGSPVDGGDGGAIAITAGDALVADGAIDGAGGDALTLGPSAATGGDGGPLQLVAGGDAQVLATVHVRGGGAVSRQGDASGGGAGAVRVDAGGTVALAGVVDARGGPAVADAGRALGGAPGQLLVGEAQRPAALVVVPLGADGGAGDGTGGAAGTIELEPHVGDLVVTAPVHADGGDAGVQPGRGGLITARVGSGAGGIRIRGPVGVRGGDSGAPGRTVPGGEAGTITMTVVTHTGDLTVEGGGEIAADGGDSSGAGTAGGGGAINLFTRDGNFSLAGRLVARGGTAPDPGGRGGDGGPLNVFTDTDADGIGGDLTIEPSGVIDVSGGDGSVGGSARNNGVHGVALFPDDQHLIAVLLDSDCAPGGPMQDGRLLNLGTVIARGGADDGWGGDVMFHGRRPDAQIDPLPGVIFTEGHGAGEAGQAIME